MSECTLCNGMGMLDGAGSICPHCDGRGKEPALKPDDDELHRGAWKDGYSAGFEAAKSWFTAQNVRDAADALRYRHVRDTQHNGYSLAGPAGVGNWHVIRKMREGEGEFFFGERLDAVVDGDIAAALPAYVKQPITKEWCERMAGLEASSNCNIEAGVPEPMPASEYEKAFSDLVNNGTGVMLGGKHVPAGEARTCPDGIHVNQVSKDGEGVCLFCDTVTPAPVPAGESLLCDNCGQTLAKHDNLAQCAAPVPASEAPEAAEPVAWMCPDDPDAASAFKWARKGVDYTGLSCDTCGKKHVPVFAGRVQD